MVMDVVAADKIKILEERKGGPSKAMLNEISLIPPIEIFATDLLFCLADLIHWGFLDAFQLYV
jgi:hypothetical protein